MSSVLNNRQGIYSRKNNVIDYNAFSRDCVVFIHTKESHSTLSYCGLNVVITCIIGPLGIPTVCRICFIHFCLRASLKSVRSKRKIELLDFSSTTQFYGILGMKISIQPR